MHNDHISNNEPTGIEILVLNGFLFLSYNRLNGIAEETATTERYMGENDEILAT